MKTILFDFDGTIADTLGLGVEVVNSLHEKYGYRYMTDEDVKRFQGMKAMEILKEMKVSIPKVIIIGREVAGKFKKVIGKVELFPGIKKTIEQLRKDGHVVGIITKTNLDTVSGILKKHGLEVDFIEQDATLFAKEKAIKKVLKLHKLSADDVVYIGDEVRDIEATKKAGIPIISVTWGFNNRSILEKNNDLLADTPAELLEKITSL